MSNSDWSVLKYYLMHSEDPLHWQVLARANDELGICESIERVLKENVALVDERDYIDYMVKLN